MTKQDLFDCLSGHPKAREAIFWWCAAWHAGAGSDLYAILCDVAEGFTPDPKDTVTRPDLTGGENRTVTVPCWYVDSEIHDCFNKLDAAYEAAVGPLVQHDYKPVMSRDVREGHVLVAGSEFACISSFWPCRVYRQHGALGVTCMERMHGIKLLAGSSSYFHALTEDANGYVQGFRR